MIKNYKTVNKKNSFDNYQQRSTRTANNYITKLSKDAQSKRNNNISTNLHSGYQDFEYKQTQAQNSLNEEEPVYSNNYILTGRNPIREALRNYKQGKRKKNYDSDC